MEARYALRTYHAIREAAGDVPSSWLYEAQFEDPQLAEHMRSRDQANLDLDSQHNESRREFT